MDFKEKLAKVRSVLFVSQENLAKIIGVSFATVNRLEKGHTQPSLLTKARFDALCKDKKIFFEDEENKK